MTPNNLKAYLTRAMNSNTPRTALEKLAQSNNIELAEAAKLHVNWAGEMSESWDEAARRAMHTTTLARDWNIEAKLWAIGAIPEFLVSALQGEVRLGEYPSFSPSSPSPFSHRGRRGTGRFSSPSPSMGEEFRVRVKRLGKKVGCSPSS